MTWTAAIEPLMPVFIDLVKDAIEASNGNTQVAIGILMGILGTTPENKTRAAMVIAKAEALREFGPLLEVES